MVYHFTVDSDSAGLVGLANSWNESLTTGRHGRRATLALFAGLYISGQRNLLLKTAERFPNLAVYNNLLEAFYRFEEKDYETADRLAGGVLRECCNSKYDIFPATMKLSVLLLTADLDWVTGMDGYAQKEYAILTGVNHRYVSPWAKFMTGSIAMHNQDYRAASERFDELCNSGTGSMWETLSCALEKHSQDMQKLMKDEE